MKVEDRLRKKKMWNDTENKCIEHAWDRRKDIKKMEKSNPEDIPGLITDHFMDTPGLNVEYWASKLVERPEEWKKLIKQARKSYGNQ